MQDSFVTFRLDPDDPSWKPGWAAASEDLPGSAFIWHNFRVFIVFQVDGVNLSLSMEAIPVSILDFALMLQAAKAGVRRHGRSEIALSDRSDQWWFEEQDDVVRVRTRGPLDQGWTATSCPAEIFERLADEALSDALRLLFWEQPALRQNTYLRSIAPE